MALTKVTNGGITDSAITSAKIDDGSITNVDVSSSAAIPASKLSATLDLSSKTITLPSASVTAHATTPTLDSPSITGTLFVDSGSTVSHTISNWSDDVTYVITPTNCTVGSITTSGVFVVTHTSGTPSYTIKATTDSLGLADSSVVTKNIGFNLTAPTISAPADVGTLTNVVYTITSTDSNDDKLILDMGSSNFNLGTVSPGSGTKSGNTVVVTGFTTGNPVVTIQFTAEATYSVTAKSVNIAGTYGDSASSSADSITIINSVDMNFLVVAGGGPGAGGLGSGGGAGGLRTSYGSTSGGGASAVGAINAITTGVVYTVTVGGANSNSSISASGITTITSTAGGNGNNGYSAGTGGAGGSGGSGGGAATGATTSGAVGSGAAGEGYDGGLAIASGLRSGGGGGASAVGTTSNGGAGLQVNIDNNNYYWAGGGGGSANGGTAGSGGIGGGASGSGGSGTGGGSAWNSGGNSTGTGDGYSGANGGQYTGGGGGGGGWNTSTSGGTGGSGVVILRIPTANYSGTTTGSPTVSTVGTDKVITFIGSGSYTS